MLGMVLVNHVSYSTDSQSVTESLQTQHTKTLFLHHTARFSVVLCQYSKLQIKLNSYLLFDSIRYQSNYSKFPNTYLAVGQLI